jgi:hypothetical protein
MIAVTDDETLSTIQTMRRQEETHYHTVDYCELHGSRSLQKDRKQMAAWATNVIDFCKLRRETIEYAMSYTDRFLQTEEGAEYLDSAGKFQLVVIASLYLAIKVHDASAMSPMLFEEISRGQCKASQIEELERKLLRVLQWNVNPPTPLSFVRLFLDVIPSQFLDEEMKTNAYFLCRAQTEQALRSQKLVPVKASTIALAALRNSMEALGIDDQDIASLSYSLLPELAKGEVDDLDSLQIELYGAVACEVDYMGLPASPTTKTHHKQVATTTLEHSTPRSVVCHAPAC